MEIIADIYIMKLPLLSIEVNWKSVKNCFLIPYLWGI